MLRSILIGIDDTESGIAAEELGIRWARRLGARLTGITIMDDSDAELSEELVFAAAYEAVVGRAPFVTVRPVVHDVLRRVEDHFGQRCGEADVDFKLIRDVRSPHVQIVVEAQNHDVALLGRHSAFEFGRGREPGQTVGKLIQGCPRPVVIAPATVAGGESIVVAYDGSLQASRTLMAFEASGLARGAEVHVLTVDADRQDATRHADRAVAFLWSHGIEVTPHIAVTSRPPAQCVLKNLRSLGAGLLVMGAYGQSAFREFFVGSVTSAMLEESPVPIFCFH